MALGPGPAGLKFWTPQGLTADNTADINNLPASVGDQFNPWGTKRLPPDTVWPNACLYAVAPVIPDTANLPAGGANWFNPWGPRRSNPQWAWFSALHIPQPVTLTAAGGSYTITGTTAVLVLGHVAGSGSYTITGSNATLALGHAAGAGSYTITGTAAGLVMPGGLPAAAGSYALTGSAAGLTVTTSADTTNLPAGMIGSYVPWGRPFPVTLLTRTGGVLAATVPVMLTAAAGSYTITGTAASLTVATPADTTNLPAGMTGGYMPWSRPFPVNLRTITGRGMAAPGPVTLTAAAGSYTITGAAASLTVAAPADTTNLPAGITSWFNPWRKPYPVSLLTRTGRPLAEEAVPPVTLTAATGSYTITGASASLTVTAPADTTNLPAGATNWFNPWGRRFPINLRTGTGRPLAEVAEPVTLTAAAGSYTLTGSDAQLVQAGSITLTCGAGAYTITGSAVSFLGVAPPIEVTPPTSPGGVGGRPGRPGRPLYKRLKLKKKRKRDECEELLDYLESLPPLAEIERTDLPPLPTTQSLLDCIPPLSRPQVRAAIKNIAIPDDDDDEDAIALLLEFL